MFKHFGPGPSTVTREKLPKALPAAAKLSAPYHNMQRLSRFDRGYAPFQNLNLPTPPRVFNYQPPAPVTPPAELEPPMLQPAMLAAEIPEDDVKALIKPKVTPRKSKRKPRRR